MTEKQTPDKGTQEEEVIVPLNENDDENGDGTKPPVDDENKDSVKVEETPKDPPVEVIPPVIVPPKDPPAPDYRKKFGDSTRENQIIVARLNELQKVLGDITKKEVPSEDEMKEIEPEWEYLTDREKAQAMKMVVLERRSNLILQTFSDITRDSDNAKKLDEFIKNEPRLKGKEEDFESFVAKPKNKGVPVEVLLNAFLFEVKEDEPVVVEKPDEQEIPPSLERGSSSGGNPQELGKKGYTDEELKELRTKNPRLYNEMIRTGKLK